MLVNLVTIGALTTALSAVTYYGVEAPFIRHAAAKAPRRRPTTPAEAPAP
jgi:peptidoglycan/LPS O-acetylase OafA/YrhL